MDSLAIDVTLKWGAVAAVVTISVAGVSFIFRAQLVELLREIKIIFRSRSPEHRQQAGVDCNFPYFPCPEPGRPAAIVIGVSGPMQGQDFSLEKELFCIGADPENDLCIPSDDYVSWKHAYLRYDKGSLFLFDQRSKNGTFLNDKAVTELGWNVIPGDRIRVGTSTFKVAGASSPPENN